MSSFLVVYNQVTGVLEEFKEFGSSEEERLAALRARAERERLAAPGVEVVVLNAASENALRRTHARYFKRVSELASGTS